MAADVQLQIAADDPRESACRSVRIRVSV